MVEKLYCHYCQKEIPVGKETRDHVVPRARGGVDLRWNRVWSCAPCNLRKADNFPTCDCNFCRRTRRRHWQQFGINEASYQKKN